MPSLLYNGERGTMIGGKGCSLFLKFAALAGSGGMCLQIQLLQRLKWEAPLSQEARPA